MNTYVKVGLVGLGLAGVSYLGYKVYKTYKQLKEEQELEAQVDALDIPVEEDQPTFTPDIKVEVDNSPEARQEKEDIANRLEERKAEVESSVFLSVEEARSLDWDITTLYPMVSQQTMKEMLFAEWRDEDGEDHSYIVLDGLEEGLYDEWVNYQAEQRQKEFEEEQAEQYEDYDPEPQVDPDSREYLLELGRGDMMRFGAQSEQAYHGFKNYMMYDFRDQYPEDEILLEKLWNYEFKVIRGQNSSTGGTDEIVFSNMEQRRKFYWADDVPGVTNKLTVAELFIEMVNKVNEDWDKDPADVLHVLFENSISDDVRYGNSFQLDAWVKQLLEHNLSPKTIENPIRDGEYLEVFGIMGVGSEYADRYYSDETYGFYQQYWDVPTFVWEVLPD